MHAARAARLLFLIQPIESIVFWRPRCRFVKGRGKRGHILADTLLLMMFLGLSKARDKKGRLCFHVAQTGKHLWRTQNVSEQNQKHFLCPALRARTNGETFVGETFVWATMCPQQCGLVCQGLKLTFITFVSCRRHQHMKLTIKLCLCICIPDHAG